MFVRKLFIIFILAGISGCAPYLEQSRPMLDAYYRGDFEAAAKLAGSIHTRKADRLLALLDKATVYNAAGQYEKSIKLFSKALDVSETISKEAALPQMGAVFANDNVMPFAATPYEKLLMHAYQIMNYAALGNYEDALVEVRSINTRFPEIYTERESRKYMKSPFAAYLSGLIWETMKLCNDAYIDYKRVGETHQVPNSIDSDIKRAAICAGLQSSENGLREKSPNLIIGFSAGRSPVKHSTEHQHLLQVFPVPYYKSRPTSVAKIRVNVNGIDGGVAQSVEDVDEALRASLDDEMPAIIARAVARLAVKEAAAVAIGEKVDKNLGIALGTMALATNRADLRSWQTLPETFQIWKGYVKPGKETILLEFLDKNGKKLFTKSEGIEIIEGKTSFLLIKIVE